MIRAKMQYWPTGALERVVDAHVSRFRSGYYFHPELPLAGCLVGIADGAPERQKVSLGELWRNGVESASRKGRWSSLRGYRLSNGETFHMIEPRFDRLLGRYGERVVVAIQRQAREILAARKIAEMRAEPARVSVPKPVETLAPELVT